MTKAVTSDSQASDLLTRWLVYWDTEFVPHLRRHWLIWGGLTAGILLFNAFFTLAFTVTESLPYHVFIVIKNDLDIKRGDYIAWRWAGGGPYPEGLSFLKQVRGMAGDTVTAVGRDFYVNGEYMSTAKPRTRKGEPLALGPTGVIPARHFYVYAPHKDSLDSRFALTGWIPLDRVKGKAIPIF
jgi:conjugal transfer pilin signal peptidase TrbI